MGVWLMLNKRYDKLSDAIEKSEWKLNDPTPENAAKAVDLVLHCVTAIEEVNRHRDDLVAELKQAIDNNKNEVAFQPDSKQALALIMGLREVNTTITKLADLLPLTQYDTDWLRKTGNVVNHGIQEYVDGLK